MSKYEPLARFLERLDAQHWRPTFLELERLIDDELPASARKREAWWSNDATGAQRQAQVWMDAGWTVENVDLDKGVVSFARADGGAAPSRTDGLHPPGAAARLADEVQVRAEGVAKVARQWGAEGASRAAGIVRKRPAASMGVGAGAAFAAGLVIGLLIVSARRSPSVVEVVEARGGDLLGLLKGRLGGWSDRADTAQSRTDDALGDLKRGLKRLHLPTVAAEAARDRAVDAIHTLRGGLKELRETVGARLGR